MLLDILFPARPGRSDEFHPKCGRKLMTLRSVHRANPITGAPVWYRVVKSCGHYYHSAGVWIEPAATTAV